MDTKISLGAVYDVSGNSALFASLILIISIVAQIVLMIKTKKMFEKMINFFLIILSLFIWSKFI